MTDFFRSALTQRFVGGFVGGFLLGTAALLGLAGLHF